jgi:hypothetical protein
MVTVLNSELCKINIFCQSPQVNRDLKRPWRPQGTFGAIKSTIKEVKQQMGNQDGKGPRKNKKAANRKRVVSGY